MNKQVIIIGSGLGGLACGYILAKNGYRVAIFEKNAQPGQKRRMGETNDTYSFNCPVKINRNMVEAQNPLKKRAVIIHEKPYE
jgi:flavin-dependent dehydrogenase